MIMINRTNCPGSLQKDADSFIKSDYSKNDVRRELLRMQHQKCCYCERDLSKQPQTERNVDHYIPPSEFVDQNGDTQWHLANQWENLLYSCPTCNNSKRNKIPINPGSGAIEIINPTDNSLDPEDHITFIIDDVLILHSAKGGSIIGTSTINKLKFHGRTDLFRELSTKKLEIEKTFSELIHFIISDNSPSINTKISELECSTGANIPFAAFSRYYIARRLAELNSRDLPKLEERWNIPVNSINVNMFRGYDL